MKKFLHTIPGASGNRQIALASQLIGADGNALIGSNGELNAHNKPELLKQIAALLEVAANYQVMDEQQASKAEVASTHREMVIAAWGSNEELAALGDLLTDEIKLTSERDGFMRRFLKFQDLNQGDLPKTRMTRKQAVASVATGPTQVATQMIRDNMVYPQEFYINARPYIEERDLQRSGDDLVEEKYLEALQAILVAEDRTWKAMVDKIIGLDNEHLNVGGAMTPGALAHLTNQVTQWGIPAAFWLIANDLWADITTNDGFQKVIDPVSQYEVLLSGKLGRIHGMEIISDQFRHPEHKVLSKGEMYVVSSPEYHGNYSDRGGVKSQIIDGTQERVPGRGWTLTELASMVIVNTRSVARGLRIK